MDATFFQGPIDLAFFPALVLVAALAWIVFTLLVGVVWWLTR